MAHTLILMNVVILLVGSWAAFNLRHRFSQTRESVLRPILHHVALIVLAVFFNLIVKYAYLNLVAEDFSTANPLWLVLLVLPGFCVEVGVAWTLVQTAFALHDRRPPELLVRCFFAGIWLFGTGLVAGTTIALRGGGVRWLLASYLAVASAALAVVIAGLVWMVLSSYPQVDPEKGRAGRTLGGLWLSGWLTFIGSSLLPEGVGSVSITLSLLWLNLVPLIWLKVANAGPYGTTLASAERSALDTIAARYDITKREREIVELILQGKSNKEIEERLFISIHTVKNHVYNIFRKLGVGSRGQLMRLVMEARPDLDG